MLPTLQRVAGADKVFEQPRAATYDDFSFFAHEVPGLYFNIGVAPAGVARRDDRAQSLAPFPA